MANYGEGGGERECGEGDEHFHDQQMKMQRFAPYSWQQRECVCVNV